MFPALADQAYALHLRGHSLRVIAARLDLDKDTVNKYIRQLERELAPKRKEALERRLMKAVERFRAIQADAADGYATSREPALLGHMLSAEREIARLQGLYVEQTETTHRGEVVTRVVVTYDNDWRGRRRAVAAGEAET